MSPDEKLLFDFESKEVDEMPKENRVAALEKAVRECRVSPLQLALSWYYALAEDRPGQLFPKETDMEARKAMYLKKYLPKLNNRSKQSLSDYLRAGEIAATYLAELKAAGLDVFSSGLIKKLLDLPEAIMSHGEVPEVFAKFCQLKPVPFSKYARKEPFLDDQKTADLWRYINAHDSP